MSKNNLLVVIVVLVLGIAAVCWMKKTPSQVSPDNWNNWDSQQKPEGNWDNWNQKSQKPQAQAPQAPNMQPPTAPPPAAPSRAPNYQDALNLSKTHKKPVLLFFTASWCSWCQKMKNETLNNPQVKKAMEDFIYCEVDVDKDRTTARQFGVGPIPTYKTTDSNSKVIAEGSGFKSATQFVTWLNGAKAHWLFD